MNSELTDCCEFLPWDTEFFGVRIARLKAEKLTEELAAAVDVWCLKQGVQCLYFLSCTDDPQTGNIAEANGYHLVDIRVTFERHLRSTFKKLSVRRSVREDFASLATLVRNNSQDSRFAFDKRFPQDASARLYQRWMERSCEDVTAAVFVIGEPGQPGGYVTCELGKEQGHGKIGLLGLAPEMRGRGLAKELVEHALDWFNSTGCEQVSVVTQGRNIAAQRLYERSGFLTRQVQLWYHKWHPSNS